VPTPEQTARLEQYLALLLEQNRAFNLTAITDPGEAWTRHVLDSLTLLPELESVASGERVVDVGSGGGLPAIPLAIARPELSFTLLEATAKKARFLAECAHTLGLGNVQVANERAETFARGPEREKFAVATSRACARLPVLLELCLPLVRVGGLKLAIKGEQAELEVAEARRALNLLHAEVVSTRRTETGVVVRFKKNALTSPKYPRRPGEPKRAPL
jgi:16S rRNA (guanine527-N7)-methyltransferase